MEKACLRSLSSETVIFYFHYQRENLTMTLRSDLKKKKKLALGEQSFANS